MIFLSNRKLKLMIITLLLLIFCFFIGLFRPKALVISDFPYNGGNGKQLTLNNGYGSAQLNNDRQLFLNQVEGKILFNAIIMNDTNNTSVINSINVLLKLQGDSYYREFTCQLGNNQFYYDNTTMRYLTTAICPVPANIKELKGIEVTRTGTNGIMYVDVSNAWSFISSDINVDLSTIHQGLTDIWNGNQQNTRDLLDDIDYTRQQIINAITTNNTTITNIQNNTQDISDSIKDDSIDTNTATSSASSWNGKNASNGTVTQLLTLPITLLQAIVNGISTSCSSFSLGSLFGTNITLPCINLSNLIGSGLFTTIDILFSGFMILAIGKKLIKIFNDFTNLKSNQIDELYGGGK